VLAGSEADGSASHLQNIANICYSSCKCTYFIIRCMSLSHQQQRTACDPVHKAALGAAEMIKTTRRHRVERCSANHIKMNLYALLHRLYVCFETGVERVHVHTGHLHSAELSRALVSASSTLSSASTWTCLALSAYFCRFCFSCCRCSRSSFCLLRLSASNLLSAKHRIRYLAL